MIWFSFLSRFWISGLKLSCSYRNRPKLRGKMRYIWHKPRPPFFEIMVLYIYIYIHIHTKLYTYICIYLLRKSLEDYCVIILENFKKKIDLASHHLTNFLTLEGKKQHQSTRLYVSWRTIIVLWVKIFLKLSLNLFSCGHWLAKMTLKPPRELLGGPSNQFLRFLQIFFKISYK